MFQLKLKCLNKSPVAAPSSFLKSFGGSLSPIFSLLDLRCVCYCSLYMYCNISLSYRFRQYDNKVTLAAGKTKLICMVQKTVQSFSLVFVTRSAIYTAFKICSHLQRAVFASMHRNNCVNNILITNVLLHSNKIDIRCGCFLH